MDAGEVWGGLVDDPWIRHADVLDRHGGPFGDAAMGRLEPLSGARVLDVGCGTGRTTWELGRRVGPGGAVVGVDLSPTFVAAARGRAGTGPVSFVVGDATTLEVEPVDAIFSRFGVMFFPDPAAAFAHLRALTRAGGRLAFACWQDVSLNPWMLAPVMASVPVLGPPALPLPGAPGPFAFAAPETIRTVLATAGWSAVEVEGLAVEQPFPAGDATATARLLCATNPILAAGLRAAPQKRDELVAAVTAALGEYEGDGGVVLPSAAWIGSATA